MTSFTEIGTILYVLSVLIRYQKWMSPYSDTETNTIVRKLRQSPGDFVDIFQRSYPHYLYMIYKLYIYTCQNQTRYILLPMFINQVRCEWWVFFWKDALQILQSLEFLIDKKEPPVTDASGALPIVLSKKKICHRSSFWKGSLAQKEDTWIIM